MRELPILFNTDMVQAILCGHKTVTRRVIKPHNAAKAKQLEYCQGNGLWVSADTDNGDKEGHIKDYSVSPCWISWSHYIDRYGPYKPGDILYVRETWAKPPKMDIYYYRANSICNGKSNAWRPSIHMPKEAARIWLKVTDVRVEQLRDITREQIVKEGTDMGAIRSYIRQMPGDTEDWVDAAYRIAWSQLWDSTCKQALQVNGWDANPWVWVVEFERMGG